MWARSGSPSSTHIWCVEKRIEDLNLCYLLSGCFTLLVCVCEFNCECHLYNAALAAYERSCALSDSADGDDLPGLLVNWGVGLTTAASCVAVRFGAVRSYKF